MRNKPTNRRDFVKTTAAALAVPFWIPATVLAAPGKPGANDRICVGLIGAGHRSTTVCHLINICRELGRKLHWDPVQEEFVGDEEANALRARPRREGYLLPQI